MQTITFKSGNAVEISTHINNTWNNLEIVGCYNVTEPKYRLHGLESYEYIGYADIEFDNAYLLEQLIRKSGRFATVYNAFDEKTNFNRFVRWPDSVTMICFDNYIISVK